MFIYTNIPAFVLRVAIFCCLFSTYPLLNHFLKTILKNLFWRRQDVGSCAEIGLNISLTALPLMFALFYPNIGTVLSYVGAFAGFILIYVLPVMVHLKNMKMNISNPILAEALAKNEISIKIEQNISPLISDSKGYKAGT